MRVNGLRCVGFGDSLMLGVCQAAMVPCDAVVGRQPHQVYDALWSWPVGTLRDKHILLSTGISNNVDGWAHVLCTLDLVLRHAGTPSWVVVIGVGPGSDRVPLGGDAVNDRLRSECMARGLLFSGALYPPAVGVRMNGDQPGIHPYDYADVVAQIDAALGG